MEILYGNSKIKKICTDLKQASKYLKNEKDAIVLLQRISYIRDSEKLKDVSELPPIRRHKLQGQLKGLWGIDINKISGTRIILKPNIETEDISLIDSVTIFEIGDYHK